MATLDVYQAFEITLPDGQVVKGGSRGQPDEISVAGAVKDQVKVLATSTTWDAWSAASTDAAPNFDFLYLIADTIIYVEFTTDANNGVGDELYTLKLLANKPLMLCSDVSYANYTANFGGGTLDVIDRIRIRNISGGDSTIRLVLIT